jgi:NAD(P)-dependent dehydrogenase (short-subunit alcohol dehydrogenase family)
MADLKDKVVLITGATSGIGKAAAKEIAKLGPRMVLVVRDQPRGMAAWEEITKASGNEKVELMVADLSSLEEIRILARDFRKKYKKLHLLVNNAATVMKEPTKTHDGFETQFAVNHLAYFLLTNLLLDIMKESAPARIVNTASGSHARAKLDLDDLQSEKVSYKPMEVYGRTKLMNILFTYELARRLEGTRVTANCFTPGFRATNLGRNMPALQRFGMRLFAGRPEKGAATLVHVATAAELESINGKYFLNGKAVETSKTTYDKELALRLWNISEKLTGLSKQNH